MWTIEFLKGFTDFFFGESVWFLGNVKYEWRKKWLENEARLNETGNGWSAPELCSSDSSVTQVA
jgi:hypothetical protein